MLSYKSILRLAVLAALSAAISVSPPVHAGHLPLAEVLNSRAGRLIFGELAEGSFVSKSLLGVHVPNPAKRIQRLLEVIESGRARERIAEIEARVNRVYESFAQSDAARAERLFRRPIAREGVNHALSEADQRLIRSLVTRELDRAFLDELAVSSYQSLKREFVAGGARERPQARGQERTKMSPQERALTYWETRKNAAASRSPERVGIEHYEIPLELVKTDFAKRISPELRDALVFSKSDGKQYVRWIINPEDTEHYKAVEKFLVERGVAPTRHKHFEGHQTASRSYIIVDPASGRRVTFSAKVSTNKTGGQWHDKKQPFGDALEARRAVDWVMESNARSPFRNIVVMDEPVAFGIPEIDQAMLVRVLGDLPSGRVTYLPGFSALHEDLGIRIALANGSNNPAIFWNDHYNKPLARALAELAAKTGLTFDSPHSQNFLIEMVGVVPTGRIALRDFGDSYVWSEYFHAVGRGDFVSRWPRGNVFEGQLVTNIGVLHGNEMPKWVNELVYAKWGHDFYVTFEAELAAQTGVPASVLAETKMSQSGRYFMKRYPTSGADWQRFLMGAGKKPN